MAHQELPLPGFDELSLGALGHRIRALTADEVQTLLEHERQHADRLPVVNLLVQRLDELEQGATPTPGPENEPVDTPEHSGSGSPVKPQGPRETGRPTPHGTRFDTGKGIEH